MRINEAMQKLKEATAQKKDAEKAIRELEDVVKAYLNKRGIDEYVTKDGCKATYRAITINRFDAQAFKKSQYGNLYAEFCKATNSMKFTFNY